jgi:glycerol uptake facilitator-like aquaporin
LVAFWVFWQAAGARRFYVIVGISTAAGIALDFAKISPLKAPYWSAIVNELLASFLLVGVLLVASSRKLMEKQPSSVLGRVAVGVATLLMFGAAIGTFVF